MIFIDIQLTPLRRVHLVFPDMDDDPFLKM